MSEELKPCPFCGIKPELASLVTPVRYFYLCPNCGIGNELQGFDRDEAQRFWNTRPIEDALRAELARLSEQTIDYENDMFLGQPIEYWMRVKAQLDADNSDNYIREILLLKHKLARLNDIIARLKDAGNELYLKGCRNYLPLGDADWAWRALMKELE